MHRVIRNFDTLASTTLRLDALSVAEAGYAAITVESALGEKLRVEDGILHIGDTEHRLLGRRVFCISIGKCANEASAVLERILGEHLTSGISLDVSAPREEFATIRSYVGTHPLPSEANIAATEEIFALLYDTTAEDLVIFCISGGGSTLLCAPLAPMTASDEAVLFTELTAQGASIRDLNIVRKHTSRARGGGLAEAAYPSEVISLIASDVPGNDIRSIASGPTVRDTSTAADAQTILDQYGVTAPAETHFIETPIDPKFFTRVTNMLVLSSRDALLAMQTESRRRGYQTLIVDDQAHGEAAELGRTIVEHLHNMPEKTVLLYAGETTVTLGELPRAAAARGGRNQEMALAVLATIKEGELLLPFASDGHDNSDHAGAVADTTTLEHARERGLDASSALAGHSSYDFFHSSGDALSTGYTGSNVSDLIIAIKK